MRRETCAARSYSCVATLRQLSLQLSAAAPSWSEVVFCASDKLCDDDAACEREVDCNLPGNSYAHIECVGHGVCSNDQRCGWECAPPQCVDLAGLELGPCDAVLGWAVVDGACAELSGCTADPFKLFPDLTSCQKACP